ncbi:MAG TPA: PA2169 family four-helix-bundle protein [Allosphingosinicella sp.]|nr:PA2169 family four-helix-bundle protein [Allosphingosinicella sp.]
MANDRDISVLNSLTTTTIDSALGFERSAEDAQAGRFAQLFRDFGAERRQVVAMLQDQVRALGGTPNDDGSLIADMHRRWVDLRAAIAGGGGDKAIVEEVERGEDYLKAKYEAALADTGLSPPSLETIRAAFQSVRAGHDKASQLKHGMAGAEG